MRCHSLLATQFILIDARKCPKSANRVLACFMVEIRDHFDHHILMLESSQSRAVQTELVADTAEDGDYVHCALVC